MPTGGPAGTHTTTRRLCEKRNGGRREKKKKSRDGAAVCNYHGRTIYHRKQNKRKKKKPRRLFFFEKRRKKSTTLGCSKRLTESNRFQLAHQQTHNRPRNEERIKAGTIDRDNIITHKNIDGDSLSLAKRFPLLVALSLSPSVSSKCLNCKRGDIESHSNVPHIKEIHVQ